MEKLRSYCDWLMFWAIFIFCNFIIAGIMMGITWPNDEVLVWTQYFYVSLLVGGVPFIGTTATILITVIRNKEWL